jgi:hypothetical protein
MNKIKPSSKGEKRRIATAKNPTSLARLLMKIAALTIFFFFFIANSNDVARGAQMQTIKLASTLSKSPYHSVSSDQSKFEGLKFENVPSFTRSKFAKDYALIAHESRVYGGLFNWVNTIGAYVVSPAMPKATFLMTMVRFLLSLFLFLFCLPFVFSSSFSFCFCSVSVFVSVSV